MATAPATVEDADAGELAARLRSAPFVRVVAPATGDSLAASGVLARALTRRSTPFQVCIDPVPETLSTDDELVVGLGVAGGDVSITDRPASVVAAETARELGADPDPILALAGVTAAGLSPSAAPALLDAVVDRSTVERRPGLTIPTDDPVDGLAHSTLLHVPQSGDLDAARAAFDVTETPDEEARRRLASRVAIEASASTTRAADTVERVLRPYATPEAPFATIGGFGDVLDAAARERPGTGVALALRDDGATRTSVLDAWRAHARSVHATLSAATTGRYDGVFVARVEEGSPARLGTVARLCLDFQSPEPAVLVVGDDAAAAASATETELGRTMADAVRAVDTEGLSCGGPRRATARFEADGEVSRLITAFREAL